MRDEIWVIDTETTTLSGSDNKATPFDPRNGIVMCGILKLHRSDLSSTHTTLADKVHTFLRTPRGYYSYPRTKYFVSYKNQLNVVRYGFPTEEEEKLKLHKLKLDFSKCHTIVGHNIPFDVLHLLKDQSILDDQKSLANELQHIRIWDTMLGTYLSSGQTIISPTMDTALDFYSIETRKGEGPKYMWDIGYDTTEIPFPTMFEYLKKDVTNTAALFLAQFQEALADNKIQFYMDQMEALFAHTMITNRGMCVNRYLLKTKIESTREETETINVKFQDSIKYLIGVSRTSLKDFKIPKLDSFISSRAQLSDLLYHQKILIKQQVRDGYYKNGKPKLVTKDVEITVKTGLEGSAKLLRLKPDAYNNYPVSEKEISKLLELQNKNSVMSKLLKLLLEYRKQSKILNTYLLPVDRNLISHYVEDNQCNEWRIHPNFNMAITATGRLSSSKPNFHNQIDDPYKEIFIAPEGYKMVEIDFNQLEIMVLGVISGDKNLCNLLRSGVDVHSYLYERIHGYTPNKKQRKPFKACSFGLIYGSSAKGLVESTGMPLSAVERFMEEWFDNFPDSQKYAEAIEDHITMNNVPVAKPGQMPTHVGKWTMPHGRTLTFLEYDAPIFSRNSAYVSPSRYNWRRPALKNYPIQALASEIVKHVITRIIRKQWVDYELSRVQVVNTVHDNGVFYVPIDNYDECIRKLKEIMTDVGPWLKARGYNPRGLEFKVDVSVGNNWFNCK